MYSDEESIINHYKQRIQQLETENRLLKERLEKAGISYRDMMDNFDESVK